MQQRALNARFHWRRQSCLLLVPLFLLAAFVLCQHARIRNGGLENRVLQHESQDHVALFPLTFRDACAFFLASLGLVMAAGGGIGGGGILVPIYILIMGFSPKHAIPLSNVSVFGGSVANTILNARKRHPLVDRPLIDWDLILVMEPLTILGALLGANLNKLIPETVIVVLLVGLLSFTAYKTLTKAMAMHEKETLGWSKVTTEEPRDTLCELELTKVENGTVRPPHPLRRRSSESFEWDDDLFVGQRTIYGRSSSLPESLGVALTSSELQVASNLYSKSTVDQNRESLSPRGVIQGASVSYEVRTDAESNTSESEEDETCNPLLARILEQERYTPSISVCTIVCLFLVVLSINIIKGGGAFRSPIGIECGSLLFWMAEAIMALFIVTVSLAVRSYLLRRTHLKQEAGYQYMEGDIEWNETSTFVYPLLCCLAGFAAGLFGIGGGIIKGPLMIALGVHPAVVSATSACMILFTSFTATTSFAVFGLIIPDYAILCLILGFVATLVGQTIMTWILQRHNRNSYIAFCIGAVVLLSAICMTLESIIRLSTGEGSGRSSGLCSTYVG